MELSVVILLFNVLSCYALNAGFAILISYKLPCDQRLHRLDNISHLFLSK